MIKNTIESFVDEKDRKGCFVVNIGSEFANQGDEIYEFTKQNLENVKEIFKKMISEGQQQGSISKKHETENLAHFLFNI